MLILNSFIHLLAITSLAFMIGNLVTNRDAINGVVNVVGIGSSFLCGVFVPLSYLPNSVISMAKCLPTYYYVKSNEIIAELEVVSIDTLHEVFINMGVLLGFSVLFLVISNIVSKKKRKIA